MFVYNCVASFCLLHSAQNSETHKAKGLHQLECDIRAAAAQKMQAASTFPAAGDKGKLNLYIRMFMI